MVFLPVSSVQEGQEVLLDFLLVPEVFRYMAWCIWLPINRFNGRDSRRVNRVY